MAFMFRQMARFRRFACRTLRRAEGNVLVLFALSAIPIMVAAGMAIDVSRAYAVKVRLGAALDDAGLAVASSDPTAVDLQSRLNQYFYGNFGSGGIGTPVSVHMTTDPNNSQALDVSATARVPTLFMQIAGFGDITVAASAQVLKQPINLEVAFVLDNTGSMFCGDGGNSNCSTGTPPSHMDSMVTITQNMVSTLVSGNVTNSRLKMAIVPYVTAVNVGPALSNLGLLDTYVPKTSGHYKDLSNNTIVDWNGNDIAYDSTQSATGAGWWGCVIEPTAAGEDAGGNGPDINEPSASSGWAGYTWIPYYWEPNSSNGYTSLSGYTGPGKWYTKTVSGGVTTYTHHTIFYATNNATYDGNYLKATAASAGPNLGCPTPMVPLTTDVTKINNAVAGLKAAENSGTISHVGMIWGWRALSPNPPFSDDQPYSTSSSTNFPRNVNGWVKAVILETDGNPSVGGSSSCSSTDSLTGFGFVCNNKMGSTSQSSIISTYLPGRLTWVCRNMAAKKIVIYAVGFGPDAQGNTALQNCAANGGKYIYAADSSALNKAFQEIANELNQVRLSR
jgi:Flp pilus assembly protein TadG